MRKKEKWDMRNAKAFSLMGILAPACLTALLAVLLGVGTATAMDLSGMEGAMGGAAGGSEVSEVSLTSTSVGGSSGESRTVDHAKSSTDSTLPYNALELTVDGAPASALVLGGQELSLALADGQGEGALFISELTAWEEDGATTLRLTAQGESPWQWRFTGQTLKKLQDSGVAWILLQGEEGGALLSTSGFISGYQYDCWKQSGLPSSEYQYLVAVTAAPLKADITVSADGLTLTADGQDGKLTLAEEGARLVSRGGETDSP